MKTHEKTEEYHLVDDDIVTVKVDAKQKRNEKATYRVRVWRKAGDMGVVLISPVENGPQPSRSSCHLARLAWGSNLGFEGQGFYYFEEQGGHLWRVRFDVFGCESRPYFASPCYESATKGSFDQLIGRSFFGDLYDAAAA